MLTMEQFLIRQPSAPVETATDPFYFNLCKDLVEIAKTENLFPSYPEAVIERSALILIGYYQDVISDAGIWRSFINKNRRLYGKTLPFYGEEENYMDYELNRSDVNFMVWYAFSMNYENRRVCYPLDEELMKGAKRWWNKLEEVYEEAPIPEGYNMTKEVSIHSEEDFEIIMRFGNWLFMHCYLMTPAFALTLSEMASQTDMTSEEGIMNMRMKFEEAMSNEPTGPLALYLSEWLYLILENKDAPEPPTQGNGEEHKFYSAFVKATGGKVIEFFSSYEDMNRFFIDALGWEPGKEHLKELKGRKDYILMVNRERGLLIAVDIAACVAHPENPLYYKEYASTHAIELLTERGKCPSDLLKFICSNHWLPDATFPETTDKGLVENNWDFIARCYLQAYYRGD